MSFDLGKLFIEWRRIVPNGVPNPNNAYHLVLLKEICMANIHGSHKLMSYFIHIFY